MYHIHITLNTTTTEHHEKIAKHFKCKATSIDLIKDGVERTDMMLTKYFTTMPSTEQLEKLVFDIENETGLEVERLKLEQNFKNLSDMDEHIDKLNDDIYFEFHVKVDKVLKVEVPDGMVLSNNPKEDKYMFFNARCHNLNDFITFKNNLSIIYNSHCVRSLHMELLISDSEPSHDLGWI